MNCQAKESLQLFAELAGAIDRGRAAEVLRFLGLPGREGFELLPDAVNPPRQGGEWFLGVLLEPGDEVHDCLDVRLC